MGEPGEILLGKYQVESELGRGGMGRVLAARHLELGELVAIKLVLPAYAQKADVVRRFMREARACAQIRSEHVCKVSDVGRLPSGEPYMVMELLRGQDLEQLLATPGPLPIADVVEYIMQALEAIAEAHAAGIVHRDLKPANLFLTQRRNGNPCMKVLDFGISKLNGELATAGDGMTQTQGILGSPLYMSPEQLESAKGVDARADIWALGVILYQLLTGRLPFVADSLPQLVLKVISGEPPSMLARRAEIPKGLESAVFRCLAKSRDNRFVHVGELAEALVPFGPPDAALSLRAIQSFVPALESASPNRFAETTGSFEGFRKGSATTPLASGALSAETDGDELRGLGDASTLVALNETQGANVSIATAGNRQPSRKLWWVGASLLVLVGGVGGAIGLSTNGSSAKPGVSGQTSTSAPEPIHVNSRIEPSTKPPADEPSASAPTSTTATPTRVGATLGDGTLPSASTLIMGTAKPADPKSKSLLGLTATAKSTVAPAVPTAPTATVKPAKSADLLAIPIE